MRSSDIAGSRLKPAKPNQPYSTKHRNKGRDIHHFERGEAEYP
jgi:hypothetical protein